jgi:SOS response regulatory protein OraA/RecX
VRPTLTALRRAAPGRVALEVDGRPWRTVPDSVVAGAGLAAGVELDRETLRSIRHELARARGFATAGRLLGRRDLSARRLAERVERTAGSAAGEVVSSLAEVGVVDDARASAARASALAARGWGDAAIEARLEGEGFEASTVHTALGALPPEERRAAALVAREPDRLRAARLLARRGFDPELVEDVAEGWTSTPGAG